MSPSSLRVVVIWRSSFFQVYLPGVFVLRRAVASRVSMSEMHPHLMVATLRSPSPTDCWVSKQKWSNHFLRDLAGLFIEVSNGKNIIPFPLIDRHDSRRGSFFGNGLLRTRGHFFAVNECLIFFSKLSYVFVRTFARQYPRLTSIVLHGVDLHFNSIPFEVIRNFDFQHWANFCIPSNPSFRLGSSVTSRRRIFST